MEETRKPARKPRATAAPKPAAKKAAAAAKSPTRKTAGKSGSRPSGPSPAEREQLVRTAAYFRAQRRGFEPGYEWEDWLAAEAEVSTLTGVAAPKQPRKAPARRAKPG